GRSRGYVQGTTGHDAESEERDSSLGVGLGLVHIARQRARNGGRNASPLFVATGLAAFGIAMMSIPTSYSASAAHAVRTRIGPLITQVGGSPFSVSRKAAILPL